MQTTTASPGHPLDEIQRYDRKFFGHPLGLLILSMNEMWERFSFYGMKTILILYMVSTTDKGGLGMSYAEAAAIYGLYGCLSSAVILPGGWISDVLWGQRKTLLYGGIVITFGHLAMAVTHNFFFYTGMGLIILGTGLLKPASTVMVSQLYRESDPRQEAGYTVYYMCINIGALLGGLVCGYLGQRVSWHYGFGAAAVGMVLGLLVYVIGWKILGPVGRASGDALNRELYQKNFRWLMIGSVATLAVVGGITLGNLTGFFSLSFPQLVQIMSVILIILPAAYFVYLFRSENWTKDERSRLFVIVILFCASVFFAAGADQRGSLFTLFADQLTRCEIFGWEFPSTWFTAVNPAMIILLTPFFAWLWPTLGKRNPSVSGKFAWAMFLSAASFAVMIFASLAVGENGERVGPSWLVLNIFLITLGEMFLGPVGISAFARLSPQKVVSQMMGIWFLKGSLAGLMASAAGGAYDKIPLEWNFGTSAIILTLVGIVLLCFGPFVRRATQGL